jgi:hypothetical protein
MQITRSSERNSKLTFLHHQLIIIIIIEAFFKVVINVSKKCSAEVFVDYLTLTMVALRSCETPKLLDPGGGDSMFL